MTAAAELAARARTLPCGWSLRSPSCSRLSATGRWRLGRLPCVKAACRLCLRRQFLWKWRSIPGRPGARGLDAYLWASGRDAVQKAGLWPNLDRLGHRIEREGPSLAGC